MARHPVAMRVTGTRARGLIDRRLRRKSVCVAREKQKRTSA
jgi:hypothetical protein